MFKSAKSLSREGVAVHWLREKSKAPVESRWSSAPVMTAAQIADTYREGYNLGFRPGEPSHIGDGLYLYVIDIDVKGDEADGDEAYALLDKILPAWEDFPFVRSGRGGDSGHVYFVSTQKSATVKLGHSENRVSWVDRKSVV